MPNYTQSVWGDEYTGPRYTYYSPLRPISPTMLPQGYTVVITEVGGAQRSITTTEPLPETFIGQVSLELVKGPDGPNLCLCCGVRHGEKGSYCAVCHHCLGTCDWRGTQENLDELNRR